MPDNFEVSVVGLSDELISNVATKANVTVERVRKYIADKEDQDNTLLRAFLFYGVGPFNKTFI